MRMKFLSLAAACVLLPALALSTAQAEIYKWTDANGVVQYTQTPPPDLSKAKEIGKDIGLSSGKAQKHDNADAGKAPKDDGKAPKTEGEDTDLTKARADGEKNLVKHQEFCEQQRGALKQLLANPVIRWKSANEEEHILTAEERTNKIAEFEKSIKEMCNEKMLPSKPSTSS